MKTRPDAEHRRHEGLPARSMENSTGCGQPFPLCPSGSPKGAKEAIHGHLTSLGQASSAPLPCQVFPWVGRELGTMLAPEVRRTSTQFLRCQKTSHRSVLPPRLFLLAFCIFSSNNKRPQWPRYRSARRRRHETPEGRQS